MTERPTDPFGRGDEPAGDPFGGSDPRWLPPVPEGAPPSEAPADRGWQPPVTEGAPGPPPSGPPPTHGRATTALVLGIVGIAVCPLICSVPAIVIGTRARREIDASGGRLGGRAQATSGIVLGWVGAALVIGFVLLILLGAVANDGGSGSSDVTVGNLN